MASRGPSSPPHRDAPSSPQGAGTAAPEGAPCQRTQPPVAAPLPFPPPYSPTRQGPSPSFALRRSAVCLLPRRSFRLRGEGRLDGKSTALGGFRWRPPLGGVKASGPGLPRV